MHYLIFSVPISRPFFAAARVFRQILIKNLFNIDVHVAGRDLSVRYVFEWTILSPSDSPASQTDSETDDLTKLVRHCTRCSCDFYN